MNVATTVGEKLDPRHFSAMSSKMAALVAYVVEDVPFDTQPRIVELIVTSDGFVMAATNVDPFANEIIGTLADFNDNWAKLSAAAELTPAEEVYVANQLKAKLRHACPTCDQIAKQHGGFGPPHNASLNCQSGRRSHCSCDTCF